MEKKYLTQSKIDAYSTACHRGNVVRDKVVKWESLATWTIGKQCAEAIDSIPANITEGSGRDTKEKIHFYRFCFGFTEESRDWTRNAATRNHFIPKGQPFNGSYGQLPFAIPPLIEFTNQKQTY